MAYIYPFDRINKETILQKKNKFKNEPIIGTRFGLSVDLIRDVQKEQKNSFLAKKQLSSWK